MDGLSVLEGNDPERTVLYLRHQAPQDIAASDLSEFLQGFGHQPQNPGLLDPWVLLAHHIADAGRLIWAGQEPRQLCVTSMARRLLSAYVPIAAAMASISRWRFMHRRLLELAYDLHGCAVDLLHGGCHRPVSSAEGLWRWSS